MYGYSCCLVICWLSVGHVAVTVGVGRFFHWCLCFGLCGCLVFLFVRRLGVFLLLCLFGSFFFSVSMCACVCGCVCVAVSMWLCLCVRVSVAGSVWLCLCGCVHACVCMWPVACGDD